MQLRVLPERSKLALFSSTSNFTKSPCVTVWGSNFGRVGWTRHFWKPINLPLLLRWQILYQGPPLLPEDEEMADNGLMAEGVPWGLENVYDYGAGGHHPIHLGDILYQRYKVCHKLGSGGFANVWLCRDTLTDDTFPRYVAVKVIMAEGSSPDCPELQVCKLAEKGLGRGRPGNLFCLPLDRFEIDGPNGLHYAFVYPVLGPRVSQMPNVIESKNPGPQLRAICLQVAEAMATLHDYGICHGGELLFP